VQISSLGIATVMILGLGTPISVEGAQIPSRGLESLTIPEDRLPAGCSLKPPPPAQVSPKASGDTRVGVVPGNSYATNPWIGRDLLNVARVLALIDTPASVPDGPPLDRRQAGQYLARWMEGIVEAYRAAYSSSGGAVDVVAVRFENERLAAATRPPARRGLALSRVVMGPDVVVVSAEAANDCFNAARSHIESLR
jgi:hypothetical protein